MHEIIDAVSLGVLGGTMFATYKALTAIPALIRARSDRAAARRAYRARVTARAKRAAADTAYAAHAAELGGPTVRFQAYDLRSQIEEVFSNAR